MKIFSNFHRAIERLSRDHGAIFLEYAMVLAFMVLALTPILPGGPVYSYLRYEVLLRITLISLPIF
ncbi:MAG: hypothetical protein ACOX9E_05780 [Lentisphaeria bacterium]|jgi:hypothetical protein